MRRKKSFQEDTEDAALSVLLMSGAQAEVVQDLNRSEKLRQNSLVRPLGLILNNVQMQGSQAC